MYFLVRPAVRKRVFCWIGRCRSSAANAVNTRTLVLHIPEPEPGPGSESLPGTPNEPDAGGVDNGPRQETWDAVDWFLGDSHTGELVPVLYDSKAVLPSSKQDQLMAKLTGKYDAQYLPRDYFAPGTPLQQLELLSGGKPGQIRLSVTKILTGAYCELQKMYQLYMGVTEVPRTQEMLRGSQEHEQIELKTHPVTEVHVNNATVRVDRTMRLKPSVEEAIPVTTPLPDELAQIYGLFVDETFEKSTAHQWSRNVSRLAQLVTFGSAREILVHAYYDQRLQQLYVGGEPEIGEKDNACPDLVLISGVIDLLSLAGDETAFSLYQRELETQLDNPLDLAQLVASVGATAVSWSDLLELHVADLKTRSYRKLPPPATQQLNFVQVAMYARFLELLAQDPAETYQMLLLNLRKRSIDPTTVLDPSLVVYLLLNNNYLIADLFRLQQGQDIGFAPFDASAANRSAENYTLGCLKPIFHSNTADPRLKTLQQTVPSQLALEQWTRVPTFELLAARTAQLLGTLRQFNIAQTAVDYSHQGEVFSSTARPYNRQFADHSIATGMDLWLAKRAPLGPAYKSLCQTCEFAPRCGYLHALS
ncbi:hypothetical protein KL905_003818 [Ogataea polymorpha]|nr:hypothetical protein KL905_003818 [Ogataea polymorpha]